MWRLIRGGFFMLALAGCAVGGVSGRGLRLPSGVAVGDISGPGAEMVGRALKSRTAPADGTTGAAVLSGRVSFTPAVAAERETVPEEAPAGRPVRDYRPDPFTRRLWLEAITPTALELKTYELERLSGQLVFDWRLASLAGADLAGGQITLAVDRTRGGYLAQAGAAPLLADQRAFAQDLENRLAEELASQLALALGRNPKAAEVETGGDPLSREARRLAAAGDWEGAKALWLKLLALNPGYAPAHFNLGLYWEYRQKPEEAWRSYREAFKSEPNRSHRAALTRLTDALARAGRRPGRS